jgi:prepilin-type N-terminal cleavage/methylation domain-containing protein
MRGKVALRQRKGLTLLELVVVMAILVAIAGILVPLLPNLLSNANNATGATNVTELNKSLQTYQSVNYQYPDGYDSLIGTGTNAGKLAPQVLFSGWSGASGMSASLSATNLTSSQVTSLNSAGITTVYNMADLTATPAPSATFPGVVTTSTSGMNAVVTPVATPISTSATVVMATPSYIQQVFGMGSVPTADLTNGAGYVVFGIGAYCTLVGDRNCGVAEAPVRGTPSDSDDPSKTYGRFAAVYRVDPSGSAATLVGCACPGGMGLMASEGMQTKYYSTVHQ